ncbi:hypothetical protein [Bacillus sp. 1P06AnD]|uniref:hypothetical protein n=1 Tax=Bacillus sp. 1P06AnD TaxID=3132208 RepID=UPI0039A0B580
MMTTIEKFLEGKINSSQPQTRYVAMLLLSARGREDLLTTFTYEKIQQALSERRMQKWGQIR